MITNLKILTTGALGGILSVLIPQVLAKNLSIESFLNIQTLGNMIIASSLTYAFMYLFFKPQETEINHIAALGLVLGMFWQPLYLGLSSSIDQAITDNITKKIDKDMLYLSSLKTNEINVSQEPSRVKNIILEYENLIIKAKSQNNYLLNRKTNAYTFTLKRLLAKNSKNVNYIPRSLRPFKFRVEELNKKFNTQQTQRKEIKQELNN